MLYLYLKSFHLIFLIAWMVSLLYLPRLFVYHSSISKTNSSYNLFLLMEKRLIKIIALPGMVLTFVFGIILLYLQNNLIYENYFRIKFSLVLLLVIFQIYLVFIYFTFKKRQNNRSGNFYKSINEIPTIIILIGGIIVIVSIYLLNKLD